MGAKEKNSDHYPLKDGIWRTLKKHDTEQNQTKIGIYK